MSHALITQRGETVKQSPEFDKIPNITNMQLGWNDAEQYWLFICAIDGAKGSVKLRMEHRALMKFVETVQNNFGG
jgi:hypothetical protein